MIGKNHFLHVVLFPPQKYTHRRGGGTFKKRGLDSGNSACHSAVFIGKPGYGSMPMPLKARASPYLLTTQQGFSLPTNHTLPNSQSLQLCNHHLKPQNICISEIKITQKRLLCFLPPVLSSMHPVIPLLSLGIVMPCTLHVNAVKHDQWLSGSFHTAHCLLELYCDSASFIFIT